MSKTEQLQKFIDPNAKIDPHEFAKNILDQQAPEEQKETETEEERSKRIIEEGAKRRAAKNAAEQDRLAALTPQAPPEIPPEEQPQELSEEAQTLACRSFYNDLRSQSNIIEKKDLNFDCIEVTSISDLVDQRLKERILNISSGDFINFINNNDEYFIQANFKNPIFQKIFNVLALEIGNNSLFLNDEHILEYGKIIKSGILMAEDRSPNNVWLKETFIPDLLNEYTRLYKGSFDPQKFNTIFIQILIAFFLDVDFEKIREKIVDYDILQIVLLSGSSFIPKVKEYVDKNSEKLSILFNISEDKVEENIMNFGTFNINFNSENIIITKTSTLILLSPQKNILGIALLKSTFNLTKNEKKAIMICRWYIPINDKIQYKQILIESLKDPRTHPENKKSIKKLLNILGCFQEEQNIENICNNNLNMFFDKIKKRNATASLLRKGVFMNFIKHPNFNFDIVIKQRLDSYLEKMFNYIDAPRTTFEYDLNYNAFLLDLANKCSSGTFNKDYLLKYFEARQNTDKAVIKLKYKDYFDTVNPEDLENEINKKIKELDDPISVSKMFNFLRIQGKEISSFDKIIVNGEIIYNKETSRIDGNKIERHTGEDYIVKIFFPQIFNIIEQVEGVRIEDISDETIKFEYCQKITKRIMGILLLISKPLESSAIVTEISQIISIDDAYKDAPMTGMFFDKTFQNQNPELIDIEKKRRIAKIFEMSFKNIDNILNSNDIVIDITKNNIILKSTMPFLIFTELTDGTKHMLAVIIFTNNFNFENNTFEITCQIRWIAYTVIFKEIIKIINDFIKENNIIPHDKLKNLNELISYYKCIYLNQLSPTEIKHINRKIKNSGAENNEWIDINLTKTEKIKQKFGQIGEKYREIEEEHPKKMMAAKGIGTTGAIVGAVALGLTLSGVALSGIFGGKTSKKNMKVNKRIKNKRITRNYKNQKKTKKTKNTKKRVKKSRKIRNTKKQRKTKI